MSTESPRVLHSLSRRRLALGLAAALGCSLSSARAATEMPSDIAVMVERLPYVNERSRAEMPASKRMPTHPGAMTHFVDTCADDGSPNSLRSLLELSPNVHSGDTIDLTQLPMMCSKITLSNSFPDQALTVTQDTLYVHGPGADQLAIDANGYSSVFRHYGNGTLQIENLTITNGYHKTAGAPQVLPRGGCIFSTGSVVLTGSVVSHCETVSTGPNYWAQGGAIYTQRDLRLYGSAILDNVATAIYSGARGGAADVEGHFAASYSTISGNSAAAFEGLSDAGGIFAYASATITTSTISSNTAYFSAGIEVGDYYSAALAFATVVNSTIAFNDAKTLFFGGAGIYLLNAPLTVQSSIVATNFNGAGPADIWASGVKGIDPSSQDNLIIASTLPLPSDTISECPKLEPLADNGGPTLTHALNHASPAIDHGDNDANLAKDQRQLARVIGANADIGAVEWSPTDHDKRIFLGRFDAKCEW